MLINRVSIELEGRSARDARSSIKDNAKTPIKGFTVGTRRGSMFGSVPQRQIDHVDRTHTQSSPIACLYLVSKHRPFARPRHDLTSDKPSLGANLNPVSNDE